MYLNKEKKRDGGNEEAARGSILVTMVKDSLSEEVVYEQNLKKGESDPCNS